VLAGGPLNRSRRGLHIRMMTSLEPHSSVEAPAADFRVPDRRWIRERRWRLSCAHQIRAGSRRQWESMSQCPGRLGPLYPFYLSILTLGRSRNCQDPKTSLGRNQGVRAPPWSSRAIARAAVASPLLESGETRKSNVPSPPMGLWGIPRGAPPATGPGDGVSAILRGIFFSGIASVFVGRYCVRPWGVEGGRVGAVWV
jgi:hypothetical protein